MFGGIKWDYAILMIISGIIITAAGQILTYRIISSLGRRSVILAAMAVLLSVGAVIMVYEVVPVMESAQHTGFFHSNPVCG